MDISIYKLFFDLHIYIIYYYPNNINPEANMKRYSQNPQVDELIKCIKFGIQCAAMYFIRRNLVNPIVNNVIPPIKTTKPRRQVKSSNPETIDVEVIK